MKRFFLPVLFIAACSNGRNELMTSLVNQKKLLEDSIKDAGNYELFYDNKSKEAIHSGQDSTVWGALADTSGIYWNKGRKLQEQLKAVNFSIDSLGKMK